ncbi:hypothetical protein ACFYKX_10830 [Cytobacillus sp. FJAT-54145]|uniref:Uncharacterized protein n=1 Tax=Cytobacillus spartinae TaxID=3299023 RepID=A0ABW6KA98_9BACI
MKITIKIDEPVLEALIVAHTPLYVADCANLKIENGFLRKTGRGYVVALDKGCYPLGESQLAFFYTSQIEAERMLNEHLKMEMRHRLNTKTAIIEELWKGYIKEPHPVHVLEGMKEIIHTGFNVMVTIPTEEAKS